MYVQIFYNLRINDLCFDDKMQIKQFQKLCNTFTNVNNLVEKLKFFFSPLRILFGIHLGMSIIFINFSHKLIRLINHIFVDFQQTYYFKFKYLNREFKVTRKLKIQLIYCLNRNICLLFDRT